MELRIWQKNLLWQEEEAIQAIETGIELVDKFVKEGYDLFGTGRSRYMEIQPLVQQ